MLDYRRGERDFSLLPASRGARTYGIDISAKQVVWR